MHLFSWQQLSQTLINECLFPALIYDQNLKIISVNEPLVTFLEKNKEEIVHQSITSLIPEIKPENLQELYSFKDKLVENTAIYSEDNSQIIGGFIKFIPEKIAENKVNPITELGAPNIAKIKNIADSLKKFTTDQKFSTLTPELLHIINQSTVQIDLISHLLQNTGDGILVIDLDGTVVIWNKVMEWLSGIESKNIIGRNIFSVFPELEEKEQGQALMQMLKGEKVSLNTIAFLRRPGTYSADFIPVQTAENELCGGICITRTKSLEPANEENQFAQHVITYKEASLAILVTQIKERKRIAEKIHNSLGQLLFGFRMEFLQKNNGIDPQVNQHMLTLLDEALAETKTIAFELMPAMLEDFGLEATLNELIHKYSSSTLTITSEVGGGSQKLDRNLEIMIFSIVQELTNNIVKYAKASKAQITLDIQPDCVYIKVIDNGIGFEKGELAFAQESTGLRNIKNSLKLFNGQIKISSQIGKGTLISIQIPIAESSL